MDDIAKNRKIEKYITNFELYSFIKCSVGKNNILGLLSIIFVSTVLNAIVVIFYKTSINIAVTFLSIICILISIFCYRKKGYYWFLYQFSNISSLEFSFMNFMVSTECEGVNMKSMLLIGAFFAVVILMILLSFKKTSNIINTIYENNKKETNSTNTDHNVLKIVCLGAPLGLLLSNVFPPMVVPFTLFVATIFYFLMTPFVIVFYYAKKYKLPDELLY